MVAALALLLATQPKSERSIETVLAEANARWYALPAATTTFDGFEDGVPMQEIREARSGERTHGEIRRGNLLMYAFYSDGGTSTGLDLESQRYTTGPIADKANRAERWKALPALEPLEPNSGGFYFQTDRGLLFRSDPPVPILTDERTMVNGIAVRRITGRGSRPARDAERPALTIEVEALIDARDGWLRRVDARLTRDTQPKSVSRLVFAAEAKVPEDEPYTFDTARIADWTKVDKLDIRF